MKASLIIILLTSLLTFSARAAFTDTDSNMLDDTWEMVFFGALGNDSAGDPDSDGHDNLNECTAATDPTRADSCFDQVDSSFDPNEGKISWLSVVGKKYHVQFSSDLQTWPDAFGVGSTPMDFRGSGGKLTLDLSDTAKPLLRGGATREVWMNISANGIIDTFRRTVLNWGTGPANPYDGVEYTEGLKAPTNYGDNYGQRLRGYLQAPVTGDYTFYLSARHQAEFWMSRGESSDNADLLRILRLTNTQITTPETWDHIESEQKSVAVKLDAGKLYYFELIHAASGQEDHLALGWTKPSDSGIEVVPGENVCAFVDFTGTNGAAVLGGSRKFARIITYGPSSAEAYDTDLDGIDDGTESFLSSFNPYDANSSGQSDATTLTDSLTATTDTISIATIDGSTREDTGLLDNGTPRMRNVARFEIKRTGTLKPITVFFTTDGGDGLVDGVPQEENNAEVSDYIVQNKNGAPLSGSIQLAGGAISREIVIESVKDGIHEYPESLSLTVDSHPSYTLDLANQRRECLIRDQRDVPENEILLVGFSVPQPGSQNPQGSAICSGKLSANKDKVTLFTSITAGFSAPQSNSHIHKDTGNPGSDPVAFSLPPSGEIANLEWPLYDNGSYDPQKMIDSLFNQAGESTTPGETPVYINWHTSNNVTGELCAVLRPATGSVEPPVPDDPPAIAYIDPVTQETELRREIVRFLTHASFGATQPLVDDLYARVLAHASKDRMAVFEAWIDEQLDQSITPQSNVVENVYASEWQGWVLRGYYDASFWDAGDWGSNGAPDPLPSPATKPSAWAQLSAHDPDAIDYADPDSLPTPTKDYPFTTAFMNSVYQNQNLGLGREQNENFRRAVWSNMIDGKDQLRQRLAFTWSQILVISVQDPDTLKFYQGTARYWDMLAENADDTFRELLEGVTYSPMMGNYLSFLKNQQEADLNGDGEADVFPDENYAREIMQLFSIGLFVLHNDGSLALDSKNGLPQATYDNDSITELSRIMTGFSFSKAAGVTSWDTPFNNTNFTRANGNEWYGATYEYPMKMFGQFHDTDPKSIAGGVMIDNTDLIANPNSPTAAELDAVGHADLADTHDWLAGSGAAPYDGHPSTPAFLSYRLIQRLVTSNPSRDYVYRVAKRFVDTGGNLKEVTKAILLDYHARSPELADTTYGRKKPPLLAYIQFARALGGETQLAVSELGNGLGDSSDYGLPQAQIDNYTKGKRYRYLNTNTPLSMSPLAAESVFNYYLPSYSPGGPISSASLVAPEFQILNESSAILNVNYFYSLSFNGGTTNTGQGLSALPNQTYWEYGANDDHNLLDRDTWIAVWNDATGSEWEKDKALVNALDEILNGGALQKEFTLDPVDRTPAAGALVVVDPDYNPYEAIIDGLTESYGTSVTNIRDKVRLAFYLMSTSATYQVQK
jgi:uncharacterized protein (DUF1800 family)